MRKLYQREWHGIAFESFTKISSTKLADSAFYSPFYKVFFKKYKGISNLDPIWLRHKLQTVEFLKKHSEFKNECRILSIGCGLGIIEKNLIDEGYKNLEITEVSKEPLQWLLPYIAPENVHIGFFPGCISADRSYDFIYLSSVEYFFNQDQLIDLLKAVIKHLAPAGTCLMIDCAFESNKSAQQAITGIKDLAKFLLDKTGFRKRGQFWGYIRNRRDLYQAMVSAGFKQINDGVFEKKTCGNTYWIEGSKQ